jgi:glycosyltransferase involved in cell wall biosynthesis
MPVLNGEAHIDDQLAALARQTYRGDWELVVADNGCSDGSIGIARAWAPRLPALTIADATKGRGLNHARNVGAFAARGDFVVFCDSDDVVSPGWLEAMAEAAPHADLVGGRLEWDELNHSPVRAWGRQSPMTALTVGEGFLPYPPGGNMGVWKRVIRDVCWDERFTYGSSDHSFGWHAQLAGHTLVFAPDALIHQRFRTTLWATARQYFRYGRSAPRLHRMFRPMGLKPDNRAALEAWRRLLVTLPDLWVSPQTRGRWIRRAAERVGRLTGSIRERVLCL